MKNPIDCIEHWICQPLCWSTPLSIPTWFRVVQTNSNSHMHEATMRSSGVLSVTHEYDLLQLVSSNAKPSLVLDLGPFVYYHMLIIKPGAGFFLLPNGFLCLLVWVCNLTFMISWNWPALDPVYLSQPELTSVRSWLGDNLIYIELPFSNSKYWTG